MQALSAATQTELALDLATQVTGPSWYVEESLYYTYSVCGAKYSNMCTLRNEKFHLAET